MGRKGSTICHDRELGIAACTLRGELPRFPDHFHPYYVVGYMAGGRRTLYCQGSRFDTGPGDLLLFSPMLPHACAPAGDAPLDFYSVNIPEEVMAQAAEELGDGPAQPRTLRPLIRGSALAPLVCRLHRMVSSGADRMEREEALCLLAGRLLRTQAAAAPLRPAPLTGGVEEARRYLADHVAAPVTLDGLAQAVGRNKYTLLRAFARQLGVTPYRYLESLRVERVRVLLEEGLPLSEAAVRAGFADQSHCARFFKRFTGLTPGQYQMTVHP